MRVAYTVIAITYEEQLNVTKKSLLGGGLLLRCEHTRVTKPWTQLQARPASRPAQSQPVIGAVTLCTVRPQSCWTFL